MIEMPGFTDAQAAVISIIFTVLLFSGFLIAAGVLE
jgi:hypothetical protein